jgi:hypothetical protein
MNMSHHTNPFAVVIVFGLLLIPLFCCDQQAREPQKDPKCDGPSSDAGVVVGHVIAPIECGGLGIMQNPCQGGEHVFTFINGEIWQRDPDYQCGWSQVR